MTEKKNHIGFLVFEKKGVIHLVWRSANESAPGFFEVTSTDGRTFKKTPSPLTLFRKDGSKTTLPAHAFLRANSFGTKTVITASEPGKTGVLFSVERGGNWKEKGESTLFGKPTVFLTLGKSKTRVQNIAFTQSSSRSIDLLRSSSGLQSWRTSATVLTARRHSFDTSEIIPLYTEKRTNGILLIYTAKDSTGRLAVGAALFDLKQPKTLLWRSASPLWQSEKETGSKNILGGINIGKYFYLYLQLGKYIERFPIARYWEAYQKTGRPLPETFVMPPRQHGVRIVLERAASNPVIEPKTEHAWEAFATFNPAAIFIGDRIHLLYRAQGYDGVSVLGYASSRDGVRIDVRDPVPAFIPKTNFDPNSSSFEAYQLGSGGGMGGCEDPRLVVLDDRIYLIYVAFDGGRPPGVALTSISQSDFLAKRWEKWHKPRLISRPGQIQKNWVIFPEKINGKYAVLHGLSPHVRIEYLENLDELGEGKFIESISSHGGGGYVEAARLRAWDNIVRGAGAPPLRTEQGWLVFYHGMDMRDPGRYKVGVMLLDLHHPEKILHRALEPVLEPNTHYENNGHKRGVVYVCGAVVKEGKLYVYYGASDRSTAVATADLKTFLGDLMSEKSPVLSKMNVRRRASS